MRRRGTIAGLAAALALRLGGLALAQGNMLSVPLQAQDGSSVSGEASIQAVQADVTMVVIRLAGMATGNRYVADVRTGSCTGPIAYPLGLLVAETDGTGFLGAPIPAAPDPTWWIQIHRAEEPSEPGVACGRVSAD